MISMDFDAQHKDGTLKPKPTLLGLPAELRNQIYTLLAAGDTRPLLVSHLMQLEAQTSPLPDLRDNAAVEALLNSVVGLHPLSRTCRQLRNEFQPLFLRTATGHRLIVNNFDLAQIEYVADFIHKHFIRRCRTVELEGVRRYFSPYGVEHFPKIKVDFLGDSNIVLSAEALLWYILKKRELPKGLTTLSTVECVEYRPKRINTFSPHSQLYIRRRTPDMSRKQAARAVTALHLEETNRMFRLIEALVYDVKLAVNGPETWSVEAVYWIRHVWGSALRRSPEDWRERVVEPPRPGFGDWSYPRFWGQ